MLKWQRRKCAPALCVASHRSLCGCRSGGVMDGVWRQVSDASWDNARETPIPPSNGTTNSCFKWSGLSSKCCIVGPLTTSRCSHKSKLVVSERERERTEKQSSLISSRDSESTAGCLHQTLAACLQRISILIFITSFVGLTEWHHTYLWWDGTACLWRGLWCQVVVMMKKTLLADSFSLNKCSHFLIPCFVDTGIPPKLDKLGQLRMLLLSVCFLQARFLLASLRVFPLCNCWTTLWDLLTLPDSSSSAEAT